MKDLKQGYWSRVKKGETSARKEQREIVFSERRMDSILVVLTTGLMLVNEHNHPLLLVKTDERKPYKHGSGTLPCAGITSLSPDASVVTSVNFYTLRVVCSPVTSEREYGAMGSVVCPMMALRESRLCGETESWDRITQSSSQTPRSVA